MRKVTKKAGTAAFIVTGAAFLTVFFGFLTARPDQACAQPIADSPCDYDTYYPSLEARAWLEAQREITQNQNLIFKPDSVLEYTCFDRFANVLAQQAINMFSETNRWGNILPANSMDNALNSLVGGALADYLNANFNHTFLGGRMRPPLAVIDYVPGPIAGGAYSCDVMNRVWEYAKCMNFIDDPNEDGFFTFASYAADPDKRFLPTRCADLGAAWDNAITAAGLDLAAGPPWPRDNTLTYLEWMDPANCGNAAQPPIETGILITRPRAPAGQPNQYVERVCLIPGCHYEPPPGGGGAAGNCVP